MARSSREVCIFRDIEHGAEAELDKDHDGSITVQESAQNMDKGTLRIGLTGRLG